jgi:hypothetical protein
MVFSACTKEEVKPQEIRPTLTTTKTDGGAITVSIDER